MTRLSLVLSDLTHGGELDLASWVLLVALAGIIVAAGSLIVGGRR